MANGKRYGQPRVDRIEGFAEAEARINRRELDDALLWIERSIPRFDGLRRLVHDSVAQGSLINGTQRPIRPGEGI
jgi:hypothetical protein